MNTHQTKGKEKKRNKEGVVEVDLVADRKCHVLMLCIHACVNKTNNILMTGDG